MRLQDASTGKTCPNKCVSASPGKCIFESVSTGAILGTCALNDATCNAVCQCTIGFRGLECSVAAADVTGKQQLRTQLIGVLLATTVQSDATQTSVVAWANQIDSLTQNCWELTTASFTNAATIINTIITASYGLSLPYASIDAIKDAIHNTAGTTLVRTGKNGKPHGYRSLNKGHQRCPPRGQWPDRRQKRPRNRRKNGLESRR